MYWECSFVAELWEELDIVLNGLPDTAAKIISMRLEGGGRTEIARELNLSRQTIHRILKLVQQRLAKRFDELDAAETTNF